MTRVGDVPIPLRCCGIVTRIGIRVAPLMVTSVVAPLQAWRRYDTDRSGYIEANELKVGCLHGLIPGVTQGDSGQTVWHCPRRASCRTC